MHRLLSAVEPGSAEETALKVARVGLARLKADQWKIAS
jgi:hypothetical protein